MAERVVVHYRPESHCCNYVTKRSVAVTQRGQLGCGSACLRGGQPPDGRENRDETAARVLATASAPSFDTSSLTPTNGVSEAHPSEIAPRAEAGPNSASSSSRSEPRPPRRARVIAPPVLSTAVPSTGPPARSWRADRISPTDPRDPWR